MNYIANILRSKGDPQIIECGPSSLTPADNLARGLGWFSIALGLTELLAARKMARALGLQGSETLIRFFGLREIGAGIATLSTEKPFGLWSRVAGDALDLITLATALDAPPRQRGNVLLAIAAVGGVTVLDVIAARAVSAERARPHQPKLFPRRSGFPKGLDAARGSARDFQTPHDMKAAI
jgi:hypothetical protein